MMTEFTSADGLVLAPDDGKSALLKKLLFSDNERPIIAQLFSALPERMEAAAKLCADMQFDGIDINMGCPDRAVEKSGCGAALMKNPARARELIRAVQKSGLPASVKTRIGYNKDELDTWLPELLAENPAAIEIHARTRKEMSDVPARWDCVRRAVEIRDSMKSKTLIVGNEAAETGCDGVMLGRAIYGNPWLYRNDGHPMSIIEPREKIAALIEHVKLFDSLLGDTSNFASMKKHFKAYISGWDGAKDLRVRLMGAAAAAEAVAVLKNAQYSLEGLR
jgi:tRNA-dihydrouridine synthase